MCPSGFPSRPESAEVRRTRSRRLVASPEDLHRHHLDENIDVLGQEANSSAAQPEMWDAASSGLLANPPRRCAERLSHLFGRDGVVVERHLALPSSW